MALWTEGKQKFSRVNVLLFAAIISRAWSTSGQRSLSIRRCPVPVDCGCAVGPMRASSLRGTDLGISPSREAWRHVLVGVSLQYGCPLPPPLSCLLDAAARFSFACGSATLAAFHMLALSGVDDVSLPSSNIVVLACRRIKSF